MPYINLKTSRKISAEEGTKVKAAFGKAIECFPGKSEAYLMVGIEDEVRLWFRGDDSEDSAIVDVNLLGAVNSEASEKMTAVICDILENELSISPDRVYVKYTGYKDWGWNKINL